MTLQKNTGQPSGCPKLGGLNLSPRGTNELTNYKCDNKNLREYGFSYSAMIVAVE